MSSIPSNLARVSNMMASRLAMGNINRTNLDILRVSEQLATGRAILRPSDDIVKAATIEALRGGLRRSAQVQTNLDRAAGALNSLDTSLNAVTQLAQQAKGIASAQVNTIARDRADQATTVDQFIRGLLDRMSDKSTAGYSFGGSVPSQVPMVAFGTGYRYVGQGTGLTTDLGTTSGVPITLGAGPVAGVSARVRGSVDLNPSLTPGTTLASLKGARGLGVSLGTVQLTIDGGTPLNIDLRGAGSVQDVQTRIQNAVNQYQTDNNVTVLGPGGVTTSGGAFHIDVAAGTPGHTLQFSDVSHGYTAQDLGLTATTPFAFSATHADGVDTAPALTLESPVSALAGVTGALGPVRITNAGRSMVVDLSTARTIGDVKSLIEGADCGVRVNINSAGTGIDIANEVSAGSAGALSISEVTGGNLTATRLGVRTLAADTRTSDLNFGRGVGIIDGVINPVTHAVDPSLNSDFKIKLGDADGTEITVDLRPSDMGSVQSVIARINECAAPALAAAGLNPDDFVAGLGDTSNGIVFRQNTTFGRLEVKQQNNSGALAHLGLTNGSWDAASATFTGEDPGKVRVDDLFTHLIDLRDSLRGDSSSGITLAGEGLQRSIDAIVNLRGMVGSYGKRVDDAKAHEQDKTTLDTVTLKGVQDVDFAAASSRYALLQTQLQAGYQVTALANSKSLLDFLR